MSQKDKELIKSPLENFFNLPPVKKDGSNSEAAKQKTKPKSTAIDAYDDKDNDIEDLYGTIHDTAMDTHQRILDDIDDIDPKYSARNYEVAANYLNLALNAADKRAKLKEHKDKLVNKTTKGSSTNILAKTITINTTDLIKQLSADIIEGEVIEPKTQDNIDE